MTTYLYDRIDPDNEIGDSVHELVRRILDHVVEALVQDVEIAKTGLRRRELRVIVSDAHSVCADEILRHSGIERERA